MGATAAERAANKAGLNLVTVSDRVEVRQGKKVLSFHSDPELAIKKALERLEEDRLRTLDPLPSDREPVLHIKKPAAKTNGHAKVEPYELPAIVKALTPLVLDAPAPTLTIVPPKIIKGSIIKPKYRERYKKNGFSCGDLIAEELCLYVKVLDQGKAKVDLRRLKEVGVANEIWKDGYDKLNPGQCRMTIGNRLRARYAEGLEIDIGGSKFVQEFK
jgi:hypothetical protein